MASVYDDLQTCHFTRRLRPRCRGARPPGPARRLGERRCWSVIAVAQAFHVPSERRSPALYKQAPAARASVPRRCPGSRATTSACARRRRQAAARSARAAENRTRISPSWCDNVAPARPSPTPRAVRRFARDRQALGLRRLRQLRLLRQPQPLLPRGVRLMLPRCAPDGMPVAVVTVDARHRRTRRRRRDPQAHRAQRQHDPRRPRGRRSSADSELARAAPTAPGCSEPDTRPTNSLPPDGSLGPIRQRTESIMRRPGVWSGQLPLEDAYAWRTPGEASADRVAQIDGAARAARALLAQRGQGSPRPRTPSLA